MINRIICFSRFRLGFETYVRYAFPFSAYKTFRTIFRFFYRIFSSHCVSMYLYFIFFQFDFFSISSKFNASCNSILKTFITIIVMNYCSFFAFYSVQRIYICSNTIQIYFFEEAPFFMTFSMQKINIIKDKIITFYWYF